MNLSQDYIERTYAGVLGKIIGVYLGRPIEGWQYERIISELGEINYYVNQRRGVPLVVTDDDISGTFTFLRSLPDHGNARELTAAQIGNSWLNYIIENRTILWWGGLGNSTGHTAYLRLKNNIPAPQSGSIALNGNVVAEQIGARIFIDGWGMISPGDPEQAADFAGRAASVSHDGESIYGAQVMAAMEAEAYLGTPIQNLIEIGTSFIPRDSIVYRMTSQVREWLEKYSDWHVTREQIVRHFGYDRYGGNCHIIPNQALVMLALLYGEDDFQKSLKIVNTSGWDTDCNSGNLGCLLGIKNGLTGIGIEPDWRSPVADRLYVVAADGGRVITDAVRETYEIVNIASALTGGTPIAPKDGARFHFELPGSVQGFSAINGGLENVAGFSQKGSRSLALISRGFSRFGTPTFIPPDALDMPGYRLLASPTLYAGQKVFAGLKAPKNISVRFYIAIYNKNDRFTFIPGPDLDLPENEYCEVFWTIPDTGGSPVAEIGFQIELAGTVYLDYLGWKGSPKTTFTQPSGSELPKPGPMIWRRAWVNGVDLWEPWYKEPFRLIQNQGVGLISQGTREWKDYSATATLTPVLIKSAGIAVRVQGMRRFYALLICEDKKARLVKFKDAPMILAEADFDWKELEPHHFKLMAEGKSLTGWIDRKKYFTYKDEDDPLLDGGVAFVVEEGTLMGNALTVEPAILGIA